MILCTFFCWLGGLLIKYALYIEVVYEKRRGRTKSGVWKA